jgi:hypothetical protein
MIRFRVLLAFLVVLATTPAIPADAGIIDNIRARIAHRSAARVARYNAACAAQAAAYGGYGAGGSASSGGNYGTTVTRYRSFSYGDGGSASSGLNTGTTFTIEKPQATFFPRLRTCPVGVDCGASVDKASTCPCGPDCQCVDCDCNETQMAFACPVVDEPQAFACSVLVERPGPFVCNRVPSAPSVEAVAAL